MRIPVAHPSDRALGRFADDGEGTATLHAHLADCADCRATIADRRALRAAARALPTPEPSPDLLARVLAERAAGARAILPTEVAQTRAPSRSSRSRVVMAAAAVLIVVAGASLLRPRVPNADVVATEPDALSKFGFFASVADAAELPAGSHPSVAPITGIDGRRIRAGTYRFARRWTDAAGRVTEDAHSTIDVAATTIDGHDAWRFASTWRYDTPGRWGERIDAETLFVARDDLRPLVRVEHLAPYGRYTRIHLAQRFVGDSVLGRMHAEGADASPNGRPVAQRLSPTFAPFTTDALAPFLFSAVNVRAGWAGSLSLLGWAVRPNDLFLPLTLRVIGSDRITVPAGTFDCWKLTITAAGRTHEYWTRKEDGVGILSRDATHTDKRGVRDIVLVSANQR